MTNTMLFQARQSTIGKSLTCPICNKICREVTGNEECCHIFCKKCITQKITEENLRSCPVCKVDLGVAPLQKLKADHSWQSLRNRYTEKRQHLEDQGLKQPKITKRDKYPAAVSTQQNGSSSNMTAAENGINIRRSSRRRILLHPTLSLSSMDFSEESEEDDDDESESPYKISRTVNVRNKVASRTKQNGSSSKSARQQSSKKGKEPLLSEPLEAMSSHELLKPPEGQLPNGHLSNSPNVVSKSAATNYGNQNKAKQQQQKGKEKKYDSNPIIITQEKRRALIEDLNLPAAQMVLESSSKVWRREIPIWFNLVPCDKQNWSTAALPPLSSNYLNVKNTVPASIIKKYLVQKFGLQCEDEVEISLCGWPIPPEMPVQDLLDAWVQTRLQSKKAIKVGSSAKDFLMVVSYSLKPLA